MNEDFKNVLRKLFLHVKSYHKLNNTKSQVTMQLKNLPEDVNLIQKC